MRNTILLVCLYIMLVACSSPSVDQNGGIDLTLIIPASSGQSAAVESISERFKRIVPFPETINPLVSGEEVKISLVDYRDTATVRQLSLWNRNLLLCYAVPKSVQIEVREYLSEFLSYSEKQKPFKSTSMIGLVEDQERSKVLDLIASEDFTIRFPSVGQAYWGNLQVDSKYALFLTNKNSEFIDENMFESMGAFADKDGKEGILGLKLLPEFTEKIGKLTGNDSTYLLHILHDEVYISKIIEPHITDPSFSMSGAFNPQDALVISTIWNATDLKEKVTVKKMQLREPE